MKTHLFISIIISLILSSISCTKQKHIEELEKTLSLPDEPYDYQLIEYMGTGIKSYINNDKATLGRVLFYDKNLSLNRSTSCGSCHLQQNAFSDVSAFSKGFSGKLTKHNSLPIFNMGYKKSFFWHGTKSSKNYSNTFSLEDLPMHTFTNPIEMGMPDSDAVVDRVKESGYYKILFDKAISSGEINAKNIGWALREFLMTISSTNSKFDYARSNNFEDFNQLELDGYNIFKNGQCGSCHYLDKKYWDAHNNGLVLKDEDPGKFYAPNLRNVAITAPYMHDGRFETLEDVIEHYSKGITDHPELSVFLKVGMALGNWESNNENEPKQEKGEPIKFNFTAYEKQALIAFLHTLTDEVLITDQRFSDPFIQ